MNDLRLWPDGCLMRFIVINERGEVFARRIEFQRKHPTAARRADAMTDCVKLIRWHEQPLSDKNLIVRFGLN